MPRRIQNVKNRLRAEEELVDQTLKAAGLWEEGLTLNDKKQLLKLIADSKSTAEEEETRRQVIYSGTVPRSTLKTDQSKNIQDNGDSDPEITYESPFPKHQRNNTVTSKPNENPSTNRQNHLPFSKREESTPFKTKNNEALQNNKHIQTLMSNASITICYAPDASQNSSNSKENIVVSETDEESDEDDCNPQIINDKGSGSQELNERKVGKQGKEVCDDIPVVKMMEASEDKVTNLPNMDSSTNIFKPTNENKKELCGETSKSEAVIIERQLNSISLENTNNRDSSSLSLKKNVSKKAGPCVFVPNGVNGSDSKPLKGKHKFLSEKPNRAYFKAAFETDTQCVKRIYSLIADWQSDLAEYQRSKLGPCKWSPPICVDRQITDSLLKKKSNVVSRVINTYSESDGESSASDTRIIDHSSDDEWNIFGNKKKTKTFRKHYSRRVNTMKQVKNDYIEEGDTEMDFFADPSAEEDILPDLNVKDLNSDTFRELSPVPSTSTGIRNRTSVVLTSTAMGSRVPAVDQLNKNTKNRIKSTNFSLNMKSIRKTFQISPDAKYESPPLEGSSSSELIDPLSVSKESTAEEQTLASKDASRKSVSPEIEEFCETPKTSNTACQWITKRGSTKRRRISNSSSMPPMKKSISEKEDNEVNESISSNTPLSNQSIPEKPKDNVGDTPAKSQQGIEPKSTAEIKHTLPKGNETCSEKDSEQVETESDYVDPVEVDEIEDAANTESNFTECPLCQTHFSNLEIEAHASECNGPVDDALEQQQQKEQPSTSTRTTSTRSRMKVLNDNPMDVMYIETRPQTSQSKN